MKRAALFMGCLLVISGCAPGASGTPANCEKTGFAPSIVCRKQILLLGPADDGQLIRVRGYLEVVTIDAKRYILLFPTKEHASSFDVASSVSVGALSSEISVPRKQAFVRLLAGSGRYIDVIGKFDSRASPVGQYEVPMGTVGDVVGVLDVTGSLERIRNQASDKGAKNK